VFLVLIGEFDRKSQNASPKTGKQTDKRAENSQSGNEEEVSSK
jgi:hypothetical protein